MIKLNLLTSIKLMLGSILGGLNKHFGPEKGLIGEGG